MKIDLLDKTIDATASEVLADLAPFDPSQLAANFLGCGCAGSHATKVFSGEHGLMTVDRKIAIKQTLL